MNTISTQNVIDRRSAAVPRGVSAAHPVVIERGAGARVWDDRGNSYIDFVGGIGTLNLGHAHPKIAEAIAEQAKRLTHTCFQVATYEPYVAVAEALNRRAPGPSPKKTLLLSTGAEATENAIKIAREYTRRPAVIAFAHGYHGRTLLALSMTGKNAPYKQHFGPFCSEVYHAPFPYEHHGVTSERAIAALEDIFESTVAPDRVAAIIIEPVLGEGGFVPAPAQFMRDLRALTTAHGIVLVADEIQSGFGRTGKFFASEHYGIEPDLITVAKSLAGGLPLAGVTGKSEIMDAPAPGGLGGTFAGNPVACAAALATFELMDDAFLARAREIGARLTVELRSLQSRFPQIEDVRGLGAMVAMELSSGAAGIIDAARERGLLLLLAGKRNVIRILVPLVIDDADLDSALEILSNSVEHVLGGTLRQAQGDTN
ncbi:MAG TPA: 4-aminobutyrate--2-oxoglutarate transaminase [Candidatus Baltobacteraceae bacterium]|nr:4-aminobutyrate--2-oxoglutarate transaminase [Candidatus Baltobacteraceae bacterium]